jgi:hypothetical protein
MATGRSGLFPGHPLRLLYGLRGRSIPARAGGGCGTGRALPCPRSPISSVTLLNNGHPITGTEAGGRAELALLEVERRPAAALVGVGEEADQN